VLRTTVCGPQPTKLHSVTTSGLQLKADFTSLTRAAPVCAISVPAYNSPMAKKTTLEDIARLMEKGFAAAKDDIADLKIELKGDIARVQEQVNSIEAHLRDTKIETRLGKLEDKVFGAPRR
jgi:hypothetical protein